MCFRYLPAPQILNSQWCKVRARSQGSFFYPKSSFLGGGREKRRCANVWSSSFKAQKPEHPKDIIL